MPRGSLSSDYQRCALFGAEHGTKNCDLLSQYILQHVQPTRLGGASALEGTDPPTRGSIGGRKTLGHQLPRGDIFLCVLPE